MAARHVGVGLALRGRDAKVTPAFDDLLGRAAADAKLQTPACDEVGRAGVFRHVQRVLVAHIDNRRADLDALRPGADRREERERRAQLAREVVHAEVRPVRTEILGGDREVDRLQERVGCGPCPRVHRR